MLFFREFALTNMADYYYNTQVSVEVQKTSVPGLNAETFRQKGFLPKFDQIFRSDRVGPLQNMPRIVTNFY